MTAPSPSVLLDLARDERGRFLPICCDDLNCDGALELDNEYGRWRWICNGLTHDTDNGPLRACNRSYGALAKPSSWYCEPCAVEVRERRCPHCGKLKGEKS